MKSLGSSRRALEDGDTAAAEGQSLGVALRQRNEVLARWLGRDFFSRVDFFGRPAAECLMGTPTIEVLPILVKVSLAGVCRRAEEVSQRFPFERSEESLDAGGRCRATDSTEAVVNADVEVRKLHAVIGDEMLGRPQRFHQAEHDRADIGWRDAKEGTKGKNLAGGEIDDGEDANLEEPEERNGRRIRRPIMVGIGGGDAQAVRIRPLEGRFPGQRPHTSQVSPHSAAKPQIPSTKSQQNPNNQVPITSLDLGDWDFVAKKQEIAG